MNDVSKLVDTKPPKTRDQHNFLVCKMSIHLHNQYCWGHVCVCESFIYIIDNKTIPKFNIDTIRS